MATPLCGKFQILILLSFIANIQLWEYPDLQISLLATVSILDILYLIWLLQQPAFILLFFFSFFIFYWLFHIFTCQKLSPFPVSHPFILLNPYSSLLLFKHKEWNHLLGHSYCFFTWNASCRKANVYAPMSPVLPALTHCWPLSWKGQHLMLLVLCFSSLLSPYHYHLTQV